MWAPDSQHFATSGQTNTGIFDAAGQVVQTCAIQFPSWVDASHVAGLGVPARLALICALGSGHPIDVQLPAAADFPVGSGHGAVAFNWLSPSNTGFGIDDDSAVWDGHSLITPEHEFAKAWSPDGSRLAVLNITGFDSGWVSVRSWPQLDVVFQDAPPNTTGDVDFDPSGRYLAFDTDASGSSDGPFLIRVVDLRNGSSAEIPVDIYGNFYWTRSSQISYVSRDGVRSTYQPDGTLVSTWNAPFLLTATSADSSTVAYWSGGKLGPAIRLDRNGRTATIQAPDKVQDVSVAPDGSAVAVETTSGDSYLYRF